MMMQLAYYDSFINQLCEKVTFSLMFEFDLCHICKHYYSELLF